MKDLLKENELKELARYLMVEYSLLPIKTTFKSVQCGTSYFDTRHITMPTWIFDHTMEYCYYYMIHEITHFITHDKHNYVGHQGTFRVFERNILADFGLTPVYSRAYIKELRSSANGQLYFDRANWALY